MKKNLLFLLFVMVAALGASAAAPTGNHLTFMGIPIDGNLNSFNQKLSSKGFKYDALLTETASEGIRIYTGTYDGYFAELYLNFSSSTRQVYGLSLFIEADDDTADDIALDLALKLWEDYGEDCLVLDEDNDSDNVINFEAYNTSGKYIGRVTVEVTDIVGDAYVMISMYDAINILKASDE